MLARTIFEILLQVIYVSGAAERGELFLKHVVADTPFPHDLHEGAKGVQLAAKGIESWQKRCWVEVP